ncbi:hypothetical protein [Arenibaculum pallidiluteum]|uniref:hypothetical protein n=1 Tax=Arenibaculum pallidiluteum TaxID=2812559 RepID=UPI001A956C3A|nr:hypothetical protein [Arenibaculum pallidiluteum]
MSAIDHVEKLKREMLLIRSAYQLGLIEASSRPRPEKDLSRWLPSVRTAYLFALLVQSPDAVTSEELTLMDWNVLSGIEIRHAQK